MESEQKFQILWQKLPDSKARLLRVFGESGEFMVPESIEGYVITEIGSYCFSKVSQIPSDSKSYFTYLTKTAQKEMLVECSGDFLEKVTLPETIEKIDRSAFYNCRNMKSLSIGKNVSEIGSDAFMNCFQFCELTIHAKVTDKTALKAILSQISSDMQVCFAIQGEISARLFYPEYYEAYDEIAPAHIFGRKITGEGFRARQSFKEGIIDFSQYDLVFPKACIEESVKTLGKIALNRLYYPVFLQQKSKKIYETYIVENQKEIVQNLIQKKELFLLEFLCENKYLLKETLVEAVSKTSAINWAEGTASLLQWKNLYYMEKKSRYEFDLF